MSAEVNGHAPETAPRATGWHRDPDSLASRLRALGAEMGTALNARTAVERLGLPQADMRRIGTYISMLRSQGQIPSRKSESDSAIRPRPAAGATPADPEVAAIARILAELGTLEVRARVRVICYLRDRMAEAEAEGGGSCCT